MVRNILYYGIFALAFGCSSSDEAIRLQRMDYIGNELRTDGYYFSEFDSGGVLANQIYFFYKNGVILYGFSPKLSETQIIEDRYRNGEFYDQVIDKKWAWGVYRVFGNEIEWEKWGVGEPPLKTVLKSGFIINDTTFHITNLSNPDGSDSEVIDELYRFKAFSPKPDSTNTFID
jgi:hypothetical protein